MLKYIICWEVFEHILITCDLNWFFYCFCRTHTDAPWTKIADVSKFQSVNSDLRPFLEKLDDVCKTSTVAEVGVYQEGLQKTRRKQLVHMDCWWVWFLRDLRESNNHGARSALVFFQILQKPYVPTIHMHTCFLFIFWSFSSWCLKAVWKYATPSKPDLENQTLATVKLIRWKKQFLQVLPFR